MKRIFPYELEDLAFRLNIMRGQHTQRMSEETGNANIGVYYIYTAYSQSSLMRVSTESGGASTIFHLCSRRELWLQMTGFIAGVESTFA